MHRRLQIVADDLVSAQGHLHRLADSTPPDWWSRRDNPGRWSAGECVAHLNLTALAFLPLMRRALEQAGAIGGRAPARFRRDLVGSMLWRTAGPPVRFRVRTTAPFVPTGSEPLSRLLATFDRLQAEQLECVAQAEGRPIGRVKITSSFDSRLRYNLYACLTILPRHQERHLWQAEQVLERLRRQRRGDDSSEARRRPPTWHRAPRPQARQSPGLPRRGRWRTARTMASW